MKAGYIKYCIFFMFLFLFIPSFLSPAFADKISGIDDLFAKLPKGISEKDDKISVIKHAQTFVISRQARKKRKLVFKMPVDAVRLNDKYTSIMFNTEITTKKNNGRKVKTPAFFSLLFVNGKKGAFDFSNGKYIGWIGKKDISEYMKLNSKMLCRYYRNAGVKDCIYKNILLSAVYGRKKTAVESKQVPAKEIIYRDEFESKLKEKADVVHSHNGADIVSGSVAAAHIGEGIVKKSELAGIVSAIVFGSKGSGKSTVVSKSDYNKLSAQVIQLEKTVKRLSALLAGVSRKGSDIVFSRVNLNLVNGTGATDGKVNGLGNLVIGYNNQPVKKSVKGSHNLSIGKGNSFLSYGGLVTGENNTISGKYAVAVGGSNNTAKGAFSSVTGGTKNSATGNLSNISGGIKRSVSGKNPHFIKKQ